MSFYRKRYLLADVLVGLASAAGLTAWQFALGGQKPLDTLLTGNRAALYGTLATLLGSLLGFVIATLAIFVAVVPDARLARVRASTQYPTVWRTLTSTIRWLGVGTLLALACLVFDRDTAPIRWLVSVGLFSWIVAGLRLAWSVWIIEQVIKLLSSPQPPT